MEDEMTIWEILFYVLIGIANLIIATEWAKYGIWEIGIQRPLNKRVIVSMIIGIGTFFIGSVMHKFANFNPTSRLAVGLVLGIPFCWIFIYRNLFLTAGFYDFNRAKIRTNYWRVMNFDHGKILTEIGEGLKDSFLAQNTVKMFKRSIAAQLDSSDKNRNYKENIGVAYAELAVLYRMMNLFEEAGQSLERGMEMVEELLEKNSGDQNYLAEKSMILFRRAELNHAQGNLKQAKQDYQASLVIDKKLNDEEGIITNETVLRKLGTKD
ncbi:MAG: tetratricopeptide repeat protein [Candidatus Nealsonbacteria bacterium]